MICGPDRHTVMLTIAPEIYANLLQEQSGQSESHVHVSKHHMFDTKKKQTICSSYDN